MTRPPVRPANEAFDQGMHRRLGEAIRDLVNPADLFVGAKLDDAMFVDNVVVFKRTSAEMLKPRGVTHNYHHRHELVIPLARAGRVHVDGKPYLLAPGQACLIFPHQFHHFLDVQDGTLNWLFITFEIRRPELLAPLRNSPRVFGRGLAEDLHGTMTDFLQTAPGSERSFRLIVGVSRLLRSLLLAREANCVVPQERTETDPRGEILASINAYVRANLNKPLTLADLARHTGYSISHLRAVFRQEFGISLGAYMRESRLSAAASILASGQEMSVEEVAKACGFVSVFVFSRAFKKAMGHPPSAYAKLLREGATGKGRRLSAN